MEIRFIFYSLSVSPSYFLEEDIVSKRYSLTQDYTDFLSWQLQILYNGEGSKTPSFPSHNIGEEIKRNYTGFK